MDAGRLTLGFAEPRCTSKGEVVLFNGEVVSVCVVCAEPSAASLWRARLRRLQWDLTDVCSPSRSVVVPINGERCDDESIAADAGDEDATDDGKYTATLAHADGKEADPNVVASIRVPVAVERAAVACWHLALLVFESCDEPADSTLETVWPGLAAPVASPLTLRLAPIRVVEPFEAECASARVVGGQLVVQLRLHSPHCPAGAAVVAHEVRLLLARDGLEPMALRLAGISGSRGPLPCTLPSRHPHALSLVFVAADGAPAALGASARGAEATVILLVEWSHTLSQPARRARTRRVLQLGGSSSESGGCCAEVEAELCAPAEVGAGGEPFEATLCVTNHGDCAYDALTLEAVEPAGADGVLRAAETPVLCLSPRIELGRLGPRGRARCVVRFLAVTEGLVQLPALQLEVRVATRGGGDAAAGARLYLSVPRGCVRALPDGLRAALLEEAATGPGHGHGAGLAVT